MSLWGMRDGRRHGDPSIQALGYTLTTEFAKRTKDELIADILGMVEWADLLENGYVEFTPSTMEIEAGDEE